LIIVIMLEDTMRSLVLVALMFLVAASAAHAACSGQVVQRPRKDGTMRDVCLDGKYSTCIRDSLLGGWTRVEAKRFCDRRKAAGAIK
jgi:hypothetical protein